jgi:spoIIIJ-associated protein
MKKVEAPTLEEAYEKAATLLSCSVTDLEYEVVQYPSKGILGLLKKNAVIVATCKKSASLEEKRPSEERQNDTLSDNTVSVEVPETVVESPKSAAVNSVEKDAVVSGFFEADKQPEQVDHEVLAQHIEKEIKRLFSHICFDIDVIEVDVVDNTALIFIDGEDAALLIGKEGYRYNALSYMLLNWLHTKYELFIKLEIAAFLTSQQEMIRNYIKPVIESVEKTGRGKTRMLDGILVQIALEQLREAFPDKYVAIKTGQGGKKFVVINAFNKKSHA